MTLPAMSEYDAPKPGLSLVTHWSAREKLYISPTFVISRMYPTPLSTRLSNPALFPESYHAGPLIRSKLLTMSTVLSVCPLCGMPMLTVSDGKLIPPSLYATTLKLTTSPRGISVQKRICPPLSTSRSVTFVPLSNTPFPVRLYTMYPVGTAVGSSGSWRGFQLMETLFADSNSLARWLTGRGCTA